MQTYTSCSSCMLLKATQNIRGFPRWQNYCCDSSKYSKGSATQSCSTLLLRWSEYINCLPFIHKTNGILSWILHSQVLLPRIYATSRCPGKKIVSVSFFFFFFKRLWYLDMEIQGWRWWVLPGIALFVFL